MTQSAEEGEHGKGDRDTALQGNFHLWNHHTALHWGEKHIHLALQPLSAALLTTSATGRQISASKNTSKNSAAQLLQRRVTHWTPSAHTWCEAGTKPRGGKPHSRAMLQVPRCKHSSELERRRWHRRCHSTGDRYHSTILAKSRGWHSTIPAKGSRQHWRCHSTGDRRWYHSPGDDTTAPSLLRTGDITADMTALEMSQHHPC